MQNKESKNTMLLNKLSNIIQESDVVLVFAGAGMSADSNLPTYRDIEGFWNDYPPYRALNKDYISMMSPYGFHNDPHFAWGFFAHQYSLYTQAIPHEGYIRLLNLCEALDDFFVVTTNVDGLFLKAGFPKSKLHEAHGTIHRMQCSVPCSQDIWDSKKLEIEVNSMTMRAEGTLPLCSSCGAVARPNIFMYGDSEESYIYAPAEMSAQIFREFRKKYHNKRVLILDIGVGAEGMKEHILEYEKMFDNAVHICINPQETEKKNDNVLYIRMGIKDTLMGISL